MQKKTDICPVLAPMNMVESEKQIWKTSRSLSEAVFEFFEKTNIFIPI